jgi:ketosteroid isomerase-like protein
MSYESEPIADTRAVANAFLHRLSTETPERIAELFAEPVDWKLSWPEPTHPAVPWIRPRSTRADVAAHFRQLREHFLPGAGEARFEPPLVDGPDAVLFGSSSQVVAATGKRFTTVMAVRLTVAGGLITHYHVYEDSLAVLEAC